MPKKKSQNITICINAGIVYNVIGLPEGWTYEIQDEDDY